ncbi:MAG TPA: Xaa-Pro peptidase family protein [Thermoleophilaceae bacterium]|nr:Xaa-Pro peptidase family protein [Thermoleophilaceae bacterium]
MTRADRLEELLAERELDALVVTELVNVRYLTGFTGTNGLCSVGPGRRDFLTDFRYTEQAASQVGGFDVLPAERDLLGAAAKRLSGRVGFEDQHVSVRTRNRLEELAGDGVELLPAGGLVEELRAVKDEDELGRIAAAAELADSVYAHLRERGLAGRTEREVAWEIERMMREAGAEEVSFPSIVAGGAHGALPHAEPREVPIERDSLVILDLGCRLDGYCSDCTRTLATGDVPDEAQEVYELVRRTQEEALGAVRAGAACRDVDAVARDAIAAAGHGERFGHGLGHGVGLEVHEEPRLSQQADGVLAAGNVVTVEPGVYLPGAFGVRIEDLVIVRDGEPEILTRFPKDLIAAGE